MSDEFEVYERMKALGVPELLELAVGDPEAPETWPAIQELHSRGETAIFDAAMALTRHAAPRHRAAGASILGQFDYKTHIHAAECIATLKTMLADADAEVLNAAAHGLGHRDGHDACEDLLGLVKHTASSVRYAVVRGLSASHDPRSTIALVKLTADTDKDVRDWATFGLGPLRRGNEPVLLAALVERLDDEDEEVRMEALGGLAIRKHPRALVALKAILTGSENEVFAGHLEAAEELADPVLFPLLEALKSNTSADEDGYWDNCLNRATEACRPK